MRLSRATVALVLSLLAACAGDEPSTPPTGDLVARLVSPNGAEGAAVIRVAAPVDSVTVRGGRAFAAPGVGDSRVVLVLTQPGEVRFTLHGVPAAQPPAFEVVEVADGSDRLRANVSGYRVEAVR